jgi:hypothetical protein
MVRGDPARRSTAVRPCRPSDERKRANKLCRSCGQRALLQATPAGLRRYAEARRREAALARETCCAPIQNAAPQRTSAAARRWPKYSSRKAIMRRPARFSCDDLDSPGAGRSRQGERWSLDDLADSLTLSGEVLAGREPVRAIVALDETRAIREPVIASRPQRAVYGAGSRACIRISATRASWQRRRQTATTSASAGTRAPLAAGAPAVARFTRASRVVGK